MNVNAEPGRDGNEQFLDLSPKERGYTMPPEWAPHERCWMAWPHREDLWRDLDATR